MKEDYFVDQEHVEVTQRLECFPQNSPPSSSPVNGKTHTARGGEWYLENRGSRKHFIQSRNLGSLYEESRSLVFSAFISVSKSRIFYPSSQSPGFVILAESLSQKIARVP